MYNYEKPKLQLCDTSGTLNVPRPTRPTRPSHQTRPVGLVVMCEHWTPKGDCKVAGNI